jgi:hypothetical protein
MVLATATLAGAQPRFTLTTWHGHLRVVAGFASIGECLDAIDQLTSRAGATVEVSEAARDTLTVEELAALCLVGPQEAVGRHAVTPGSAGPAVQAEAATPPMRPAERLPAVRIHGMPPAGPRRGPRIHPIPSGPEPAAAAQPAAGDGDAAQAEGVASTSLAEAAAATAQMAEEARATRMRTDALRLWHAELMRAAEHQPLYRAQVPRPPVAIRPLAVPWKLVGRLP